MFFILNQTVSKAFEAVFFYPLTKFGYLWFLLIDNLFMEKNVYHFHTLLYEGWQKFNNEMPSIIFAVIVFIVGIFIIKQISKVFEKIIGRYSKDSLVTDFIVNIISFVFTLILLMIVLSVVGWGSLTNKILAGAGITTFIVGFALKDIGENFLAGIIMAFRRPFKIGDLIEINGLRGSVLKLSLRETTIKTADGRDVYIPNAIILKNPLQNYTIDHHLRNDFTLGISVKNDIEKVMEIIEKEVNTFEKVLKSPSVSVAVESIEAGIVKIKTNFWFHTEDVTAPGAKLKSDIIIRVIKKLTEHNYDLFVEKNE